MAYTLNGYFHTTFCNSTSPRVLVYPNNTIAGQLLNFHKEKGAVVISIAECLPDGMTQLAMPNQVMNAVDAKIQSAGQRAFVVGIDGYLALLDMPGVTAFMSELRWRLDNKTCNADYLLSLQRKPVFPPRYSESRSVIYIDGNEEEFAPLRVETYPDTFVKQGDANGYKELLVRLGQYIPEGNHRLILPEMTGKHAGIGNVVTFVWNVRDIAARCYGIDADLNETVLRSLLIKSSESGQNAEVYLAEKFGKANYDVRSVLKRLLELTYDDLFAAYIWLLQRKLPGDSYISRVLSGNITPEELLRKYVVDTAVFVLTDPNAKKYADERANALKEIKTSFETLVLEFIGRTKNNRDALSFLNCGTDAERIEIIRRVSQEDLSLGIPAQYRKLLPSLADYFYDMDYGNEIITSYFKEYRRLKILNLITDDFVKRAFDTAIPTIYRSRDIVLQEMQERSDIALLVVDAMGAEYMPLLLAMAKRYGMNAEESVVAVANRPTETVFNQIKWNGAQLDPVKGLDNIVHNGAEKHEPSNPDRNFSEALKRFETQIMNSIGDGLTRFHHVVVTADHGATRLAVLAKNGGKAVTLPWNKDRDGEPMDWRYSIAPIGVSRSSEFDSEYFPDRKETYWVVRGYNRLPKKGGKLYELHGGATLEERLVPVVMFTANKVIEIPNIPDKKPTAELVDEFEGLI